MLIKLSRRAQREAQPVVLRHTLFNSIGVGLSFGSIISLLALHYGAGDTALSFIYAGIFTASIAALLAPPFLNGRETTSIWKTCWGIRAFISLGYLLLPLLPGNPLKVVALISLYYLFLAVRSIGVNALFVAQKALCPSASLQSFSGKLMVRTNLGLLGTGILSFFILEMAGFPSQELAFLVLLGIGVAANFISAGSLRRLPKTGYVDGRGWSGLAGAFHTVRNDARYREIVWLSMLVTAQIMCSMFIINYLKTVAGYSSGWVALITSIGFLTGAAAAYVLKVAGDHLPYRILFFAANILMIITGLCWGLLEVIPDGETLGFHIGLFICSSFGLALNGGVIYRLQATRLPEENSYQVSLIYQFSAVVTALATVGILSLISQWRNLWSNGAFHNYSGHFVLWAMLSMAVCIFIIKVRGARYLSFKEDISSLMPANLLGIFRYYRAGQLKLPEQRRLQMDSVMQVSTPFARKLVLEGLNSSALGKRVQAYQLLNRRPYPEAFETVLNEARDSASPLRTEAITTLGFYRREEAIEVLTDVLNSASAEERAFAVKSLVRLEAAPDEEEMLDIWRSASSAESRLQILLGLAGMRRVELLLKLLREELPRCPEPRWTQTLLLYAVQACDRHETLVEIFDEENREAGAGLAYILEESDEKLLEGLDIDGLKEAFEQRRFSELARFEKEPTANSRFELAFDASSFLGLLLLWIIRQEPKTSTAE